ncbi:MAG: anthranilate synthase component I family protein [Acidobacteriota bacterium]
MTASTHSKAAALEGAAAAARHAIPHSRELLADGLTPLEVYRRLARTSGYRFLFESVTGGEQISRFSFLGAAPRELYRLYPDRLERQLRIEGEDEAFSPPQPLPGEPLEALRGVLSCFHSRRGPIPFTGGFVGFFGYDLIRLVERLPDRPPEAFGPGGQQSEALPVAVFARMDDIIAFDHAHQRVVAIANEVEGEVSVSDADARLDALSDLLCQPGGFGAVPLPAEDPQPPADVTPSLSGEAFQAAVRRAKEYIVAGDIFQVVVARRFTVPRAVEPLTLYRALRRVNPSPYMVLLESPDVALVGASPEMLVRKEGSRVETRPIAGTRPRGVDADGDQVLAEDLQRDPKERAEHVMLVDLGRNDLGRVGAPGTVRVTELMEVERYSHVMHMVSNVEAELEEGYDGLDALLACFPAGTVSGAPKIRAMEIIDELEPESRGPYAGAVGYFSYTGDVDTCITIRTLVVRNGETSVTAGAGIVADSDPLKEQLETENKAAALLATVGLAAALEREGKGRDPRQPSPRHGSEGDEA